jgi:hypothetical protein
LAIFHASCTRQAERQKPAVQQQLKMYGDIMEEKGKKIAEEQKRKKNRERLCPDLIAIVSNLISTFQIL